MYQATYFAFALDNISVKLPQYAHSTFLISRQPDYLTSVLAEEEYLCENHVSSTEFMKYVTYISRYLNKNLNHFEFDRGRCFDFCSDFCSTLWRWFSQNNYITLYVKHTPMIQGKYLRQWQSRYFIDKQCKFGMVKIT